jgi:transcriptional regulator
VLTDTQLSVVRERALAALHPNKSDMQKELARALDELREGIAATKRMPLERCEKRRKDERGAHAVAW